MEWNPSTSFVLSFDSTIYVLLVAELNIFRGSLVIQSDSRSFCVFFRWLLFLYILPLNWIFILVRESTAHGAREGCLYALRGSLGGISWK